MTPQPALADAPDDPDVQLVKVVANAIHHARLPLNDEKATQQHLSDVFTSMKLLHAREFRLADCGIVDFFVQAPSGKGVGLEVKMNSARPAEVLRQLVRYATHDLITSLVLITNKAIAIPPLMNGKRVFVISLGRAWL